MTARSTERAVAETATVEEARRAAGGPAPDAAPVPGGPGSADPLLGDMRRAGLLPLLVLHHLGVGRSYGNELMERIGELTGGLLAVNPNTMYPLLRSLETRGFVEGDWEHPERRSRRFYRLTDAGAAERERLAALLAPRLDRLEISVTTIRREVLGRGEGKG